MKDDKYALLSRVSLLKGLSSKLLSKISGYARFHRYRRGERIFSEDSSGECLYVLVSGRVKIYSSAGTRSKTFALLEPGDFFGEMALLGEPTRSASARAILDTELLVLQRKDFRRFLKADSVLTLTVLKTLCSRLRRADKEIEMLSFQNVVGRTAITLTELETKYGKPASGDGTMIDADITQQELADLVGTAREMVTRVLTRFRKMNAIKFDKSTGKMVILNRDKLKNCIYT
jgi:CRP-like cAMP-binding protein